MLWMALIGRASAQEAQPEPETVVVATPAPESNGVDAVAAVVVPVVERTPASVANAAIAQAEGGQTQAALDSVVQALVEWPDDPALLRTRGSLERRLGDNAAAIRTHEHLLALDPEDTVTPALLALLLREASRDAEPKARYAMLTRVWDLAGSNPDLAVELTVAAAQAGKAEDAIRVYETLPDSRRRGTALLRAAADSYRTLSLDAFAAPLYGALLDKAPRDAELALTLAESLIRADRDSARSRIDALLLRFPDNVPLLKLRLSLEQEGGDFWRRVNALAKLQTLDPADVAPAAERAALLLELGCVSLARQILDPYAPTVPDALSQTLEQRAQRQRAAWAALPPLETPEAPYETRLLSLAYGDVEPVGAAAPAFSATTLVEHLEYLREQGFTFVTAAAVADARRGRRGLPPKAALLVFQGGYASFETQVLPLLEQYGYPVLLAVATGEVREDADALDASSPATRLTWEQLQDLAARPGVDLASMSHALGAHVQSNPQGHLALASISRRYLPATKTYETLAEYRDRVVADLRRSQATLKDRTGRYVDFLVWPEGEFTPAALAQAENANMDVVFAQQRPDRPPQRSVLPLTAADAAPELAAFASLVARGGAPVPEPARGRRVMPMELAPLSTLPPASISDVLDAMVQRAVDSGADTVYLQTAVDDNGDGMMDGAFFPNRVLPVRMDILSHAANLLRFRGLTVFLAMPTLNIRPGGLPPPPEAYVMEFRSGQARPSQQGRLRLSPFHAPSRLAINQMYEDLASFVSVDGIVFGQDLHLSDREDFSPEAARFLRERLKIHERSPEPMTMVERARWAELKASAVESLIAEVRAKVTLLHPQAEFTRSIFAPALTTVYPLERYAQHYPSAVASFDYVWVDVAPLLYTSSSPADWIAELAEAARRTPGGLEKTVFALSLHHKRDPAGLPKAEWLSRLQTLHDANARHFAYYPDLGPTENTPKLKLLQDVIRDTRATRVED